MSDHERLQLRKALCSSEGAIEAYLNDPHFKVTIDMLAAGWSEYVLLLVEQSRKNRQAQADVLSEIRRNGRKMFEPLDGWPPK